MKRIRMRVLLPVLWLSQLYGYGQSEKLHYWDDIPGFLEAQTAALSGEIQQVLKNNPPQPVPSEARKLALFALDGILHDTRLDSSVAVRKFVNDRMKLVLEDLKAPFRGKGMKVYKLYNQGFLIRTASVTVGFDLVLANSERGALVDSVQMADISRACDVLFVSHVHGDHADPKVAKMFTDQKKSVFVPTGMWEGISQYIRPVRDAVVTGRRIALKPGATIEIKAFPGHQGETVVNNVYTVTTPEGYTVMHTGDQYGKKDLEWIGNVHEHQQVDVLLVQCWINDIGETVKGIRPKLVISGHENEMGHTIDHREPYWLTFRRMKALKVPFLVMVWGENYLYR